MPIEIRELVIKATVISDGGREDASDGASPGNGSVTSSEEIINICVEKVLEILKQKNER